MLASPVCNVCADEGTRRQTIDELSKQEESSLLQRWKRKKVAEDTSNEKLDPKGANDSHEPHVAQGSGKEQER